MPGISPGLTIGIVNWNSRDYLRGCLASIKENLKDITYEVIVVDNNSADDSAGMVGDEFPGVNLIKNPGNSGYARGNNQILEMTGADKLLLLNPDVLVLDNSFKLMADFLDANQDCAAVSPRYLNPDGSFQRFYRRRPLLKVFFCKISFFSSWLPSGARDKIIKRYEYALDSDKFDRITDLEQPAASCLMLRTAVLRKIGLFDEGFPLFFNDVDLCERLRKAGYKIFFIPQARVIHFLGKGRRMEKYAENREFIVSWLRYFQKNRSRMVYWSAVFLMFCEAGVALSYYCLNFYSGLGDADNARAGVRLNLGILRDAFIPGRKIWTSQ